jgi:hypothetical protein
MRRGLRHPPGVARRTQPTTLAGEGDQEVMAALRTSGPGEAIGEDSAFQITPEFPFHIGRHALPVPIVFPCEREVGLQVLLDDLVEGGLLGMATAIGNRATSR